MGFWSISPNMLMSFQYGLNIIPSDRDQFYYRELSPQQNLVSTSNFTKAFEGLYTLVYTTGLTSLLTPVWSLTASVGSMFGQSWTSLQTNTTTWKGTEFLSFWLFNKSSWGSVETLISSPRNYLLDSELLNGSTFSFTSSSALVMAELNTLATLVRTSV